MKFAKMQGCGNDYVLFYDVEEDKLKDRKNELAKIICDRHYGIGADGVLFVKMIEENGETCFSMEIYNEDGTKAQMCGNGIRCVAKYVYEKGYTDKKLFFILCEGAKKTAEIMLKQDETYVKINMGKPDFQSKKIPVLSEKQFVLNEPWGNQADQIKITCVSMGNPHTVVYVEHVEDYDVETMGKRIAYSPLFPEHTNVEFVEVIDKHTMKMRVWERGVGETLACGTGACAAMVTSCINGLTAREVTVKLLGGKLFCEWNPVTQDVFLTGPAKLVFEGEINIY